MERDVPLSVRPLERRDRRVALEKHLGEHVDDAPRVGLAADRKAGAMGWRRLHSGFRWLQFLELLSAIFRESCGSRVNRVEGRAPYIFGCRIQTAQFEIETEASLEEHDLEVLVG